MFRDHFLEIRGCLRRGKGPGRSRFLLALDHLLHGIRRQRHQKQNQQPKDFCFVQIPEFDRIESGRGRGNLRAFRGAGHQKAKISDASGARKRFGAAPQLRVHR
jgi:hypothetical protein